MSNRTLENGPAAAENPWIEFRPSGIHGMGGYARTFIPNGMEVIEYVGERISKAESLIRCEQDNPFIFGIDEEHDLDGNVEWNPARFLNHSCEPNCEAIDDDGRIWIVALCDIQPGTELTFNYGYSLEEYQDHPCLCGKPRCVRFMVAEEHHDLVRRRNEVREAGAADPIATAGVGGSGGVAEAAAEAAAG